MSVNPAFRVLDANANRACEGLRVLEDLARFFFNNASLSEQAKQMRHRLRQHTPDQINQHRDISGDVGTAINTAAELQRSSLAALINANAKRVQEALRVIEEQTKLCGFDSALFEALRYESYNVESLLLAALPAQRLQNERVYVLIDGDLCDDPCALARILVAGGAGIIQYRAKSLSQNDYFIEAKKLRAVIDERCLFIVNDHVAVAAAVRADGVHLGQDDLSPQLARAALGPLAIIGLSTHSAAQVQAAHTEPIDYIGIGPMFATQTKSHEPVQGPELLQSAGADMVLPSYAIGGLNAERITEIKALIPHGVAVAGCICQADDPVAAYHELADIFTA